MTFTLPPQLDTVRLRLIRGWGVASKAQIPIPFWLKKWIYQKQLKRFFMLVVIHTPCECGVIIMEDYLKPIKQPDNAAKLQKFKRLSNMEEIEIVGSSDGSICNGQPFFELLKTEKEHIYRNVKLKEINRGDDIKLSNDWEYAQWGKRKIKEIKNLKYKKKGWVIESMADTATAICMPVILVILAISVWKNIEHIMNFDLVVHSLLEAYSIWAGR